MPVNEGLANLSHYAFVITVMAYALAVLAFACDFAFGIRFGFQSHESAACLNADTVEE